MYLVTHCRRPRCLLCCHCLRQASRYVKTIPRHRWRLVYVCLPCRINTFGQYATLAENGKMASQLRQHVGCYRITKTFRHCYRRRHWLVNASATVAGSPVTVTRWLMASHHYTIITAGWWRVTTTITPRWRRHTRGGVHRQLQYMVVLSLFMSTVLVNSMSLR